jgi:hypothetical protein
MGTGGPSGHAETAETQNQTKEINHAENTNARPGKILPTLQGQTPPETIWSEPVAGGHDGVPSTQILRPDLHGQRNERSDQSNERQEQPSPILEAEQEGLRELWVNQTMPRPSRGPEPAKQRAVELDDALRLMPSSYASASIVGDLATIKALQALFPPSAAQRALQHTLLQNAQAWRPPSRSEIQRAWESGAFKGFQLTPSSPLSVSQPGRSALLRGYGNAIVPQVAAEFILSFMDA